MAKEISNNHLMTKKELKEELHSFSDEMKAEHQTFRVEMKAEHKTFKAEVKADMDANNKALRAEVKADMRALKAEIIEAFTKALYTQSIAIIGLTVALIAGLIGLMEYTRKPLPQPQLQPIIIHGYPKTE